MNRAQRRAQAALARRPTRELAKEERNVAQARARIDQLVLEIERDKTHLSAKLSEIVDEMADLFPRDGSRSADDALIDSIVQPAMERLRPAFLSCKWRGATPETVDKIVANQVADRSYLYSDITLALACSDRVAIMASEARRAGRDVVEEAHAEYRRALGDPRAAPVRDRLVRAGWSAITPATFEDQIVGGVLDDLDRSIQVATAYGQFEEMIRRRTPQEQEAAIAGFTRRVEASFRLTRQRGALDAALNGIVMCQSPEALATFAKYDGAKIDAHVQAGIVSDGEVSWASVRDLIVEVGHDGCRDARSADIYILRRIVEYAKVVTRTASSPGNAASDVAPMELPRHRTFQPDNRTWDHAYMRLGAQLWAETYAKGMTDADSRAYLAAEAERLSDWLPSEGHFAALWAVHAFQRMTTSHTYASALACTDVDAESLAEVRDSWRAWEILVPNGLLAHGDDEIARILVAVYDSWAEMRVVLRAVGTDRIVCAVDEDADTLATLLTDWDDLPTRSALPDGYAGPAANDPHMLRRMNLARRLVAGLLLSLQNPEAVRARERPARPGAASRREGGEPAHRFVIVGHPLKIDCREAVSSYIATGKATRGGRRGLPQVQWMVRGHWRQQACGVGRLARKTIWIHPHWAGKADAPILTKPRRVEGGPS